MQFENDQPVSSPVIRNGYDFQFEFNGLSFRGGGSPLSGKEFVYVNDDLVSSKRSRSTLSKHEFSVDGNNYKLEFEVLDKSKGELACRLYYEDKLVKLFAAHPKRLFITKPLFAISVIVALLIHDDIITSLSLSYVLGFMALLVAIEVIYPLRHIWIMELEV
ncbi:MAG: hypothetical protein HND53_02145 [Proteobacteria bacterium]|nr:hypothetical protein [Pseudomonadota bacterium]NOG59271.1 hypothetical protein [Pseudomonadota bacterium]